MSECRILLNGFDGLLSIFALPDLRRSSKPPPHRAVVSGPTQLKGARVSSPDIRAGMALLIAALGAKGTTEIQNIDQIDRGYENIEQRLNDLGAKIQRVIE